MSRKGDGRPFDKPGPRDELVTRRVKAELDAIDSEVVVVEGLDPEEAPERLARHATDLVKRGLDPNEQASDQARRVNEAIRDLSSGDENDEVDLPPQLLYGIKGRSATGSVVDLPPSPATPFSQSDLLVNAEGQPNIGSELKAELASADRVDLICAFVIWSGVRHLRESLKSVIDRGGEVRVITTTYMGATEKRAVDELFSLGAEVRVALDARTTKLHAKAWLLERDSGLTTAFVGSSNLSHTALFDGLEWNVRLSSVDAHQVINRVRMTFASHWESEHFVTYDPEVNGEDLTKALREHNRRSLGETSTISFANLEVAAYPHQQRMLESLTIERERHDHHRNLVVAATGTGKTVVAALDYRQLSKKMGGRPSLLFIAHRERILEQSIATYRAVMRDGSFGELLAGGRAVEGDHVFAMIQMMSEERIAEIDPETFDVVVIDEFHHAKASSYDRLLNHLRPKELLGLTATPERLDGQDVTEWFGGRIAVELRLWEAIDQGFLVPFQYFGVADGTDLGQVAWRRGGYAAAELSNLYTGDDLRVSKLLESIQRIVLDPGQMKALGFCVSTEHAHFMTRKFTEAGLPSLALTGEDDPGTRDRALADLAKGDLKCIFSVEVLGEGVDVPDVDCLLLLRPTESATLFTQQLGRGLRRAEGKSHLTVIDMIGQHRKEFRFDNRLSAIVDRRKGPIDAQVEAGFPFLPAGCSMDLDRKSSEVILENLREAGRRSLPARLISDLKQAGDGITLTEFLDPDHFDHRIEDIYRSNRSWTYLRREANLETPPTFDAKLETLALRNLSRLTHVDDPERCRYYRDILGGTSPPDLNEISVRERRLLTMLAWGLGSGRSERPDLETFLADLWKEDALKQELDQLLSYSEERSRSLPIQLVSGEDVPLSVHARYSREEIVAALGSGEGVKPKGTREGVLGIPGSGIDAFFVTLKKAERDYSPTTMYRDYAINRELFHWESQSGQAPHQPVVKRYIEHQERGGKIFIFVRERKTDQLGTAPFTFLGPAEYVSHEGEFPVQFIWKLATPMPAELFESARSVAAA